MNSSLRSDFQGFINNRLDIAGKKLITHSEYQNEMDNLKKTTRELRDTLTPAQAVLFQDIDDSNLALLNMYENFCYQLGFRDAFRIMTGE